MQRKCRKTAFTHDHVTTWPRVFPFLEYANHVYRSAAPDEWRAQTDAVPDVVRLRGTAFTTVTANQNFRTAVHTDVGDYDKGFGFVTTLTDDFDGCMLGMPTTGLCVDILPGDALLFNTHILHGNTEVEGRGASDNSAWSRLSVVLYYRFSLGETKCTSLYATRGLTGPQHLPKHYSKSENKEATIRCKRISPIGFLRGVIGVRKQNDDIEATLNAMIQNDTVLSSALNVNEGLLFCFERGDADLKIAREWHDHATGERNTKRQRKEKCLGFSPEQFTSFEADLQDNPADTLCNPTFGITTFGRPLWMLFEKSREALFHNVAAQYRSATPTEPFSASCIANPVSKKQKNRAKAFSLLFALFDTIVVMFEAKNGVALQDAPAGDGNAFVVGCLVHFVRFFIHHEEIEDIHPEERPGENGRSDSSRTKCGFVRVAYLAGKFPRYLEEREQRVQGGSFDALYSAMQSSASSADAAVTAVDVDDSDGSEGAQSIKASGSGYSRPRVTSWIDSPGDDYQTEDATVDYTKLGIPAPESSQAIADIYPQRSHNNTHSGAQNDPIALDSDSDESPHLSLLICKPTRDWTRFDPARLPEGFVSGAGVLHRTLCGLKEEDSFEGCTVEYGWGGGQYDVVLLVCVLSRMSEGGCAAALERAGAALPPHGVLCVKEYGALPVDAAQLTPQSVARHCSVALKIRRHLEGLSRWPEMPGGGSALGAGGGGGAGTMPPDTLLQRCHAAGLHPICGLYQTPASTLNEYYAFFKKG